jgi:hypothetical protein
MHNLHFFSVLTFLTHLTLSCITFSHLSFLSCCPFRNNGYRFHCTFFLLRHREIITMLRLNFINGLINLQRCFWRFLNGLVHCQERCSTENYDFQALLFLQPWHAWSGNKARKLTKPLLLCNLLLSSTAVCFKIVPLWCYTWSPPFVPPFKTFLGLVLWDGH